MEDWQLLQKVSLNCFLCHFLICMSTLCKGIDLYKPKSKVRFVTLDFYSTFRFLAQGKGGVCVGMLILSIVAFGNSWS